MTDLTHLFESNQTWAAEVKQQNPNFFYELSKQQAPEYLWIGCSDSRVPANQIVRLPPGEVFVHRNIANLVVHTDLNCLSVIQYAVEVLKVKHIIVCGHYGCGGVKAALEDNDNGLIDNWLGHIKDTRRLHAKKLENLDPQAQHDLMCDLNVIEQVHNVGLSTVVKKAWQSGADLTVHGWIYSINDGILNDLNISISSTEQLKDRLSDTPST